MRGVTTRGALALVVAVGGLGGALGASGCAAGQPVECVCECDGVAAGAGTVQPAGTAVAKLEGGQAAAPAAPAPAAKPTPTPAKPAPAAAAPARRPTPARAPSGPAKAGPASGAPGSGTPVTLPDAELKEIADAWTGFANGAIAEDLEAMKKFMTERFAGSISRALETQKERLYKGMQKSLDDTKSGVKVKSVGVMSSGNHDVLLVFGTGHEDHVVFFKEGGRWVLNRL